MKYKQIAFKLRWREGGERKESARPRDLKTQTYSDLEGGTIVEFGPDANVNIPNLLRLGAIEALEDLEEHGEAQ